jgi:hypothetical protein
VVGGFKQKKVADNIGSRFNRGVFANTQGLIEER